MSPTTAKRPPSARTARLRVLVLEPEPAAFAHLMASCDADPRLDPVGDRTAAATADLALVAARQPEGSGAAVVGALREASPGIGCVALFDAGEEGDVLEMLAAGAIGAVHKRETGPRIARAIHGLDPTQVRFSPGTARQLFARIAQALDGEAGAAAPPDAADRVRATIAGRRIEMVFQPIVDLHAGQLIGVEALARFTGEPRRSPDAWLQEAESVGLREQLEIALLREATAHASELPQGAFMTVNLCSEVVTSGGFAEAIPPALVSRLVLEITDQHRVEDYRALAEALAALRRNGMRVAVNDTGQGLASLKQVAQLAPDFIKLRRSLTRDIDQDSTRRALAFALTSVATQIGAAVVAEGIETSAELDALRALGISYGQGYLIARPQPLADGFADHLALPHSGATPHSPVALPGRAMRSLHESSQAAFALLARELPGSNCYVSALDHRDRRVRIVCSSGELAHLLQPGHSVRFEESFCYQMASGNGPRVCRDVPDDPVYGSLQFQQRLGVGSYVGVPLELDGGGPIGVLGAVARPVEGYDERALAMMQAVAPVLLRALQNEAADQGTSSVAQLLRTLAASDRLTGALNAITFRERLEHELVGAGRRRSPTYLVHLAPDSFPAVEARYGRAVVELVARDVVAAMTAVAEGGDVVGRVEEDAFVVLLRQRLTRDAAEHYLTRLVAALGDGFARRNISLGVRLGMVALDHASGAEALAAASAAAEPLV